MSLDEKKTMKKRKGQVKKKGKKVNYVLPLNESEYLDLFGKHMWCCKKVSVR